MKETHESDDAAFDQLLCYIIPSVCGFVVLALLIYGVIYYLHHKTQTTATQYLRNRISSSSMPKGKHHKTIINHFFVGIGDENSRTWSVSIIYEIFVVFLFRAGGIMTIHKKDSATTKDEGGFAGVVRWKFPIAISWTNKIWMQSGIQQDCGVRVERL